MRDLRLWTAAAAAPAAAAGFSLLAGLRAATALYTRAAPGYHAWFRVDDGRPAVPLFRSGVAQPALLRFSRAAGMPQATA